MLAQDFQDTKQQTLKVGHFLAAHTIETGITDHEAKLVLVYGKSQQESWTGLLCLVFEQLLGLPDEKFKTTIPVVYVHICDILSVQITSSLREALCKIMKRIGTIYNIVN